MASEIAELSSIKDEDLLRRMWQQTEDFGRKKEIRAHMYKLREERLRNFYTGDMDSDAGIGMSKSPMIPSHGDSLADQSFQSFKAKEIRDCESPTRLMKFGILTPDTSGWNVISSSEVSSDGKEQYNSTLATTDAVKDVPGGKTSFSGKNEQLESHKYDGDDKNYTTTSGHSSNTVLKEHVVIGDVNNGRTETKSNTMSSSTKTITSSKYQSDNAANDDLVQEFEEVLNSAKRSVRENKSNMKNEQFERIPCDDFDKEYFNTSQSNSKITNNSVNQSSNQQSEYEIRRNSHSSTTSSIDAKKIQREAVYLANAPGQLISRSVEYPDANTKVITETKTLPDGSTVTTTKYETRAASSTTSSKASKQEKSTTSRVITEDRAEKNRIEVIVGDKKNVVNEMVNSRRIVDGEKLRPESETIMNDRSVKQEFYRNDDVYQDNIHRESSHQENIRNVNEVRVQQNEFQELLNQRPTQETNETQIHRENVFSNRSKESVNSHDRSSKENENRISRMEVKIDNNHKKDNITSQLNTERIYDNVSIEKQKTVKKDLSKDQEHYIQSQSHPTEKSDNIYGREPVQEEEIIAQKQTYHVCTPSHDHSPKLVSKPDHTNKRITVDHNPTHEAFARSLRCVTPEKDSKRSIQSSTHSVKSNYTYTDHGRRSPSRDTNISDTSKLSSTTITKTKKNPRNSNDNDLSPSRKSSPDKPSVKSAISSEIFDVATSESQQIHSKRVESTTSKNNQTNVSTKQTSILKSEDHYDHPRNNQPINTKSTPSTNEYYDVPRNNTPVHSHDNPNRKISSNQPSYTRPTASSTRHNIKPDHDDGTKKQKKHNEESIYETISDRPSNDRRQQSKPDSRLTYTTSVTRETEDYRDLKKSLKKQSATLQSEHEYDSGRSNSPTSSVSDIEYVNFTSSNRKVTDLDEIEAKVLTSKNRTENEDTQDGLMLSTHKKKEPTPSVESDTDTIVGSDDQQRKPFYLLNNHREKSPVKEKINEDKKEKPPLIRSETYEERCRTMLGMKTHSTDFADEEKATKKTPKEMSIDLIHAEQNFDTVKTSKNRTTTLSPERNTFTIVAKGTVRSPSQSPERKPKTLSKDTVTTKQEKITRVSEDNRFDTFTRTKNNETSLKTASHTSPERTHSEPRKTSPDTSTFSKKTSKISSTSTTSPNRSANCSPERKEKAPESVSESTKKLIKHETRSNSFRRGSAKINENVKDDVKLMPSKKTPDSSPERELISRSKAVENSTKKSPNRSPSTSPVRKNPIPKESIVEATKKFMKSENQTECITNEYKTDISQKNTKMQEFSSSNNKRASDKSPTRNSVRSELNRTERDIEVIQSSKSSNKTNKPTRQSCKSPIRSDLKLPSHTDETFVETTDTFFSETATDTIKRRPTSPSKTAVGKSNSTSSDRKAMRPNDSIISKDLNRKFGNDDKNQNPKKPSNLSINADNQDGNSNTTNTYTRKKSKESSVTLTSPTKPTTKNFKTTIDTLSTTSGNLSPAKMKQQKPGKAEAPSKNKAKPTNNYSTDDDSDNETKIAKTSKKIPITERKDSAPVYRSTKVDKDIKISRSTSEHFSASTRKGSKREIETVKSPQKFEKRPAKCVTTKTINLSTKNTLNSEDMENVIIDIQQAKSSREPTPNRIIPTPVSPEEDTGKPRYPDTVHEPDDEHPKRRPQVKNIPIFEENTKEFVSCHITEISEDYGGSESDECMLSVSDKVTKFSSKITSPTNDKHNRRIIDTVNESSEANDECHLSVHDKVSKFIATAEEVSTPKSSRNVKTEQAGNNPSSKVNEKVAQFTITAEEILKTKASSPFIPEPINNSDLLEDDCLLTVNDKVTKFLTASDNVSKTVNKTKRVISRDFEDIDEEMKTDECLLSVSDKVNKFVSTAEKLSATAPQKSPELVAKIERQVSRRDNTTERRTTQEFYCEEDDFSLEKERPYDDKQKASPKAKITDRYLPNKIKATERRTTQEFYCDEDDSSLEKEISYDDKQKASPKAKITDRYIPNKTKATERRTTQELYCDEDDFSLEKEIPYDDKQKASPKASPKAKITDRYIPNKTKATERRTTQELYCDEDNFSLEKEIPYDDKQKVSPKASPKAKITDRYIPNKTKATERRTTQELYCDEDDFSLEKEIPYDDKQKASPKAKITDRYIPNKIKATAPVSVPITLQSIDVVKKAKSIFEKESSPKIVKQVDILSRPSIWEEKRSKVAEVKLTDIGVYKRDDDSKEISSERHQASRSPEPHQTGTSKKDIYEKRITPSRDETKEQQQYQQKPYIIERSLSNEQTKRKSIVEDRSTPDRKDDRSTTDKPSYMNHTVASLEHIRRDSIEINKSNIRKTTQEDEVDQVETRNSMKFGVELKRTNSQQSPSRRKSSSSEIPHVEEIFELELLERMLETVVGYEQRRRIRAQIRLVKKQMQDQSVEILNKSKNIKRTSEVPVAASVKKQETSPVRKTSPTRRQNEDEYTSKYSRSVKVDVTTGHVRRLSPNRKQIDDDEVLSPQRTVYKAESPVRRSSPNRKHFIQENSTTYRSERMNQEHQKSRSPSPKSNKISISSNLKNSELRQVNTSKSSEDVKPIWATKNILKKASDNNRTFKTTSGTKKTTVTKVQKQNTIEPNDDCVTSSYGIGPTDEDGKPLFGIRALKKKSPIVQTSKVSGTIIQETLYSDNGSPPVGNRTTTMYSSDPQDIRLFVETNGTASNIRDRLIERENSRKGITTITTSQTIGVQDSADKVNTIGSNQVKIVRRGSVKELSEKFIQKESSKSSERTASTYPKAGLILRTQSSRESTPGANSSLRSGSADFDDCDIEVCCSSSRTQTVVDSDDEIEFKTSKSRQRQQQQQSHQTHQTRSFLNNSSKVSDVQDVLNRMRNADNVVEDGDTEEDKEARALLNKFLGASVLMSGMESMVPREITTIVGKPTSQKHVTTTRVTKTIKSTTSPSTTREIKIRDIDSIWDEQLLKELLEQSSSYEERRKLRTRLRQVMAEKEACADIVASVTADLKQQKLDDDKKKVEVKQATKNEESEEDDDEEYEYEEVEVTEEEEEESEHEVKVEVKKPIDSQTKGKQATTATIATIKVEEKKEQSSQESNIQVKSNEVSKTVTTTQSITNARTVSTTKAAPAKPISPFAKFRQLDKQVTTQSSPNSPNSPSTPKSPGGAPLFKFTDPVLSARAATVKDILLQWCQSKTKEYENVQITNFSTAWSDGLAFCALCHHFLPDSFDYTVLTPKQRRHNFTLAFRIMDEKAGIAPLLDVEDMVMMKKPDWKCVFTYVQSIHRRFRNVD